MGTNPMALERLEPRLLLSDTPVALLPSFTYATAETQINESLHADDSTTTLQLLTGESLTLVGISPSELVGRVNLTGFGFELDTPVDRHLDVSGQITNGLFSEGLVDIVGAGVLTSDLQRSRDLFSTSAQAGAPLDLKIERSAFQYATLELTVLADIQINGRTLELDGSVAGKLDGSRRRSEIYVLPCW